MGQSVTDADRERRASELQNQRSNLVRYMRDKMTEEDWHGVADAACDLREIDRELSVLRRG